jgi:hypothetical protein
MYLDGILEQLVRRTSFSHDIVIACRGSERNVSRAELLSAFAGDRCPSIEKGLWKMLHLQSASHCRLSYAALESKKRKDVSQLVAPFELSSKQRELL